MVSNTMTQGIIDVFKTVQIKEYENKGGIISSHFFALNMAFNLRNEAVTAWQPCHRVKIQLTANSALLFFSLGYVYQTEKNNGS